VGVEREIAVVLSHSMVSFVVCCAGKAAAIKVQAAPASRKRLKRLKGNALPGSLFAVSSRIVHAPQAILSPGNLHS
jgi:hypothetical protein